jgi:hypothetical protein
MSYHPKIGTSTVDWKIFYPNTTVTHPSILYTNPTKNLEQNLFLSKNKNQKKTKSFKFEKMWLADHTFSEFVIFCWLHTNIQ